MHMSSLRQAQRSGLRASGARRAAPAVRPVAALRRSDQAQEDAPAWQQRLASGALAVAATLSILAPVSSVSAKPEGVNRPELLPKEYSNVIDVAGFLAPSEEKRIATEVASLERDTGFKLRVLAQNYPETPGLAIRDYWGVDDRTIVFVADPTFGDILNFNVGQEVDLEVPRSFWSRLAGKYGNKFYIRENGESASILNAVSAIDTCLREEPGRFKCSNVQGELGEEPSGGMFSKGLGLK